MDQHTVTSIRLKNRMSELERVSEFIGEFAARHRLPEKAVFEIVLAVDEVLTNVISYAYDDDREHEVAVHLSMTADAVRVEVEDDGRPFDPLTVVGPELDQPLAHRPVGQLGLHLVRSVTDRLEYRREHGKNVLTLVKTLAP